MILLVCRVLAMTIVPSIPLVVIHTFLVLSPGLLVTGNPYTLDIVVRRNRTVAIRGAIPTSLIAIVELARPAMQGALVETGSPTAHRMGLLDTPVGVGALVVASFPVGT